MTEDVNTYGHYLQLVAANMFYLVLAVLNQQKRSRGMLQTATQTEEGQECVPQQLMTGMFYPPMSSFTQRYIEKTIRFQCTLAELYLDQKAAGK